MKTIIKNFEAKHKNGQHFSFDVYFKEENENIYFFDTKNNKSEKIETITTIGEQFIYDFREALEGFNLLQFLYELQAGEAVTICDITFKNLEEEKYNGWTNWDTFTLFSNIIDVEKNFNYFKKNKGELLEDLSQAFRLDLVDDINKNKVNFKELEEALKEY